MRYGCVEEERRLKGQKRAHHTEKKNAQKQQKMYALVDCNNFFVSCERVFRPDLQKRPVVVLSGNDGCVVARSNEVKQLGIKMGVPLFEIKHLVKQYGIVCFSSNFSLYGDLSNRVMSILSAHTERLYQYSIDEAFLLLDHVAEAEQKNYCEQLVKKIQKGIGIPVSIGIAPTKTLAKMASKFAKKYPGYKGACGIISREQREKALALFPLEDVWGIGRRTMKKCQQLGLTTALDFAQLNEVFVRNLFNLPGWRTWRELNGYDEITFSEVEAKQSIAQTRTFAQAISDRGMLEKCLADFVSSCASKLRQQHSVCKQILFFAETSRFRLDEPICFLHRTITLPTPTSNTTELIGYVISHFRKDFRPGYAFKRAGVICLSITPDSGVQQSLFDDRDRLRDNRLQQVIDKVNSQYGKRAITLAVQIPTGNIEQVSKREHLSPCYSTNIRDIITLKC